MNGVTVFTKPGCVQCDAVIRALIKAGLAHTEVDLSRDADARDFVMSLGYLRAPVVYAAPNVHFSGYRPDRLAALVAA